MVGSSKGNPFDTLPCMVKRGLSETQARILNLGENLKRENLNILQEARAIEHLRLAGIPRDHVAQELGMSSGWVQTRYYLLALPEDIQQQAAAGLINQAQIKQLYSLRDNKEKQYEAVRAIKEARAKGEKLGSVGARQKQKTDVKKERKRQEMFDMIDILAKTKLGYGIHTRVLAWGAGQISSEEFFTDVRQWHSEHGLPVPTLPTEF
jgi:ParB-like chromosome segregation protein Spo0J